MRAAIIENGVVTNIIEVTQYSDWPGSIDPQGAGIGWFYSNGTFTAPPPPAPVVPTQATNAQVRAVLLSMPGSASGRSLFQDVDDAVTASGTNTLLFQMWNFANDFVRTGGFAQQLAAQFHLTTKQLDDIFVSAVAIST